jgi:hypothetical protein
MGSGRAIAQAVSRWLPTAAARVRSRVWSSGIWGGQSGAGAGFLRVLRFPLPIFIPPLLHNHSHLSSEAGSIGQKWPQYKGLSPTPLAIKIIINSSGRKSTPQTERPLWSEYFEFINSDLTVSCESVTECIVLQLINHLPLRLQTSVTSFT